MIRVTRINGEQFALNADLIERVEGHPDTVLTLHDGNKYVVSETVDAVIQEIREHHAAIQAIAFRMDRGDYSPTAPIDLHREDAAVVPFPTREER